MLRKSLISNRYAFVINMDSEAGRAWFEQENAKRNWFFDKLYDIHIEKHEGTPLVTWYTLAPKAWRKLMKPGLEIMKESGIIVSYQIA